MPPKKQVEDVIRINVVPDGTQLEGDMVHFSSAMEAWAALEAPTPHIFSLAAGVYRGEICVKKPVEFNGVEVAVKEPEDAGEKPRPAGVIFPPAVVLEVRGVHAVSVLDGDDRVKFRNMDIRLLDGGNWNAVHVAGGRPSFQNCRFYSARTSGVGVSGDAAATFSQCSFRNCSNGSGICIQDNAQTTVIDCEFGENALNGVEVLGDAQVTASGCLMHKNRQCGIVLAGSNSKCQLTECSILRNFLSGIEINKGCIPTITKCKIESNGQCGVVVNGANGGQVQGNEICTNRMHGVLVSNKATTDFTENVIGMNIEVGVAAYDRSDANFTGNKIRANLWGPWMASPRSEQRLQDVMDSANELLYVDYPDSDEEEGGAQVRLPTARSS